MRPSSAARGFTLVELLVVIGIVALLLALLLPALSAARAKSRALKCGSQLRQIAAAGLGRGIEVGYLPLAGDVRIPDGATGMGSLPAALNDSGRRRYVYVPAPNSLPTHETVAPLPVALLPYLGADDLEVNGGILGNWDRVRQRYRATELYECPSAPAEVADPYQLAGLSIGDSAYTILWGVRYDYALNEGVLGYDHRGDVRRKRGNLARVGDASRTALTGDVDSWTQTSQFITWSPSREPGDGLTTLADVFERTDKVLPSPRFDPNRHRERANVAFMDGHVESILLNEDDLSRVALIGD
jgi:prepilin-type processing-associated H-X9-DG protein/prepilin-type N-terminal cleavage/methylation domain-containing protein